MKTERRRLFNRRPVCFAALSLAAGILLTESIHSANHLYRLIPILVAAAVAVALLSFARTRRLAFIAVVFVAGAVAMSAASDIYDSRLPAAREGAFTAQVTSEIIYEDGTLSFYVEELHADGEKVYGAGRVYADAYGAPDFGVGDIVRLEGRLLPETHEPFDTYFASSALKGEYYTVYADSATHLADGEADLLTRLRVAVKRMFYENTDSDTAAICTALVLGDKRGMDSGLYEAVQASGLAHILAVSGLHVTALASAVMWLLRKCRVKSKVSFAVVLALTFAYVALCSFTPSALRAFVMTATLNLGTAFGLKRDLVSSLGLAAFLILLFAPFSVMHIGFLLSVFAVLGIFMFAEPLRDFFVRGADRLCPSVFTDASTLVAATGDASLAGRIYDLPAARRRGSVRVRDSASGRSVTVKDRAVRRVMLRLSEAVSVSVSANLTSLPLAALFFGKVQTLFVLSNIFILPYMMIIYTILLIITPFALITGLHGMAGIFDFLLVPFTAFTRAVGAVSFASVDVTVSVAAVVVAEIWLALASRFFFFTRRSRAVVLCAVAAAGAVLCAALALA